MHHSVDRAAVQGRNVRLASLLTMGESWHNNHHAFPGSARLGLYPGEWDPGWWVLVFLRRLGLAWNIRLPHHCTPRTEVRQLDEARQAAPAPRQALTVMLRDIAVIAAGMLGRHGTARLHGPCATLPVFLLRKLAGCRVVVTQDPAAARLQLRQGPASVTGLPALLLAIGSRNACAAVLAGLCMP
ncbi:hypothetical protein U6N72_12775, partial [Cutibacterium acnes]